MNVSAAISEMYERNVVQAGEWARVHGAALARVYAAFAHDGEWPRVETLQRELNRRAIPTI